MRILFWKLIFHRKNNQMIARFYEFRSQIIQPVIFEGPPIGKLDFYPKSGKIIVCSVPRSTINTFLPKTEDKQPNYKEKKYHVITPGNFFKSPHAIEN